MTPRVALSVLLYLLLIVTLVTAEVCTPSPALPSVPRRTHAPR